MRQTNYTYEGTQQNFATLVLENSNKGPVVVNFWAVWAAPCHRLFPLLVRLAGDYGGKFLLVNVNTDEQAPIAQEYGVKSLPLIKIFRAAAVVEEMRGYQPEPELRCMLDRHVGRESDAQLKMAVTMYQQGDIEAALSLLAQAALEDQDNLRLPATLAKLLIAQHRYDEAETLLRRLPQQIHEQSDTSHLLAHVGFLQVARKAPHEDALIAQLKADPKNLQARYELAALAVVNDNYEAALDNLLELMRNGREFKEGVGHKSLLAIFDLLGHDHKLVERYRAHMFSVLH